MEITLGPIKMLLLNFLYNLIMFLKTNIKKGSSPKCKHELFVFRGYKRKQ